MNPSATLSQLFIYPVKSLGGYPVSEAKTSPTGFEFDRNWMVVDETGTFLTQRQFPAMALVGTAVQQGRLRLFLKANPADLVEISTENDTAPRLNVRVWNDQVLAQPCESLVSQWLSDHLNASCTLVQLPGAQSRFTEPGYAPAQTPVSFADGYPYLIVGEASLAELNRRMETPLPMDRFRPNIVISGSAPFAEDEWTQARIGELPFHLVKPCGRCPIPTIDQQTAERGAEPLKTLATFRQKGNKVLFGMNSFCPAEGMVKVGDPVYAN